MYPANCSNTSLTNQSENKVSTAVLGLCFILGVPGNIAVLAVLIRRSKEGLFTFRLMLSLAVSDLLTLLPLPVWIWTHLNGWDFGSVICKILSYVVYCCIYSSMLCVTLMSLQRYLQVLHSHRWAELGARGQNGLLCGIWMVSGVLASYAVVQRTVECDQYGLQQCYPKFGSDTEQVATSLLEILMLVICFSLLVYFYCRLHRGVSQSPFFSSNRMTKLITRIVVVFFIFWIPIPIKNIVVIIAVLYKNNNLLISTNYFENIAEALTFINSCVNPFLYTFSLRELQQQSSEHAGQSVQNGM